MSAITLPGTYPGLLRPCSPVIVDGVGRVISSVEHASDGTPYVNVWGSGRPYHGSEVALDLRDGTGRWHTALWIVAASASDARWRGFTAAELELLELIAWGEACSDSDAAELRDLAVEVNALLSVPHAG